jgi:hypothetical protein
VAAAGFIVGRESRGGNNMKLRENREAERSLRSLVECGLAAIPEIGVVQGLATDAFLTVCLARAETLHLHIKVDDTARIPVNALVEAGAVLDHGRHGFVKYRFPGGVNVIFSHIQVSADDLNETESTRRSRPFLDHIGIDLRQVDGDSRRAFDALPAIAEERGWAHAAQGGQGRPVFCCHVEVAEKHWLFPPDGAGRPGIPLEIAFGPLKFNQGRSGCDLRPANPRKAVAMTAACCAARP